MEKFMPKSIYFKNKNEWHNWLAKNYDKANDVWLVYYKKHTGKPTISYDEALDEALCFGWIDSTVNKIDDEKYMQRWTPRRAGSIWSERNYNKIKKLAREGRMTKEGLDAAKDVLSGKIKAEPASISDDTVMPKEMEKLLKKNKTAWENFDKFSPSTKKLFYYSIESAKRPETREKRLKKALKAAIDNNKFGYI